MGTIRGAPKKSPDKAKNATVQIRISESEKAILQDAADRDGRSLSNWLRTKALMICRQEIDDVGKQVSKSNGG